MNKIIMSVLALAIGGGFGYATHAYLSDSDGATVKQAGNKQPLYWVAPMDPKYKRDKPGKSPMGMDLIPVYADEQSLQDKPGTVKIDPAVVNNLGVKTALVSKGVLTPKIHTVGYVGFDDSQVWQLNLRVSGWVENTHVHAIGEQVKKGDVLFSLYSPELVNAQDELFNAYRVNRPNLINGARERLLALGLERQQIEQLVKQGKSQRVINIYAPDDGIIASLNIRNGSYLTPAATALSAGSIDKVWVNTEIFERQLHWIKQGTPAVMTLASQPGKTWVGKVDYIYPIIDSQTRTLRVRLVFDNRDKTLKPNMFANVSLEPQTTAEHLLIPSQAVIRTNDMTRVVLAQGEGKFRSARIKIGREAAGKIEVVSGLSAGERIVTSAQFLIDSESSLSADLSRINSPENKPVATTVWAKGNITKVMQAHRMLTIHHQPVAQWNWPSMDMNFTLAQDVDWQAASVGQSIDFQLHKTATGQYEITQYQLGSMEVAKPVTLDATINMVMADFHMLTIQHPAVQSLGWKTGEMNFTVSDAIDLSAFKEGQQVTVTLIKQGSDYQLSDIAASHSQHREDK
ncbi:efflux RND transporter periplasmic adaptor subunit [Vibrio sp. CAIM 722]|uniref:Efflux RND transporter periplasmic adaptor subunit n=1 Tax=Vibrio eleionomae TaxID=2653505 RepID=A0A7X4LLH2_9VIBR|nr:efflux RND transporter periplasmic adaptor subunit [Vibrio eleionomae]MZI94170.1 efflux RND transporter periplasmic adaptor subunit [Vibrio eleionomae]